MKTRYLEFKTFLILFTERLKNLFSLENVPYWIAAFATGLVAVGYSTLFSAVENMSRSLVHEHPYFLFAASPACMVAGWLLVRIYAPEAQGSGIPQVMAALDLTNVDNRHPFTQRLLGARTLVIKVLSSTLCVVGGGAVGREGPTIQIGAGIFRMIGQRFESGSKQVNLDVWIITGAAAGISAAFNTPLGGLVYAVEELATQHFNRFKTSLISAVIISGLASQWITGSYLYLGFPQFANTTASTIPWTVFVASICGLLGGIFGKVLFKLSAKRRSLKSIRGLLTVTLICSLLLSAIVVFFETRGAGSGRGVVTQLLFSDPSEGTWELMAARFVTPILSYLTGCAGGIFAPSLAAGGSIGAFLANSFSVSNYNLFVLLGMIAFLTGVTHAPFTSFVLVLEMTDKHSAIFPMMLSAVVALVASRLIDHQSFYEHVKKIYIDVLKGPQEVRQSQ